MTEPRRATPVNREAPQEPKSSTPADDAPLAVADRCDRCGAQAFVRVVFRSGDLLFCSHHFTEHEMDLTMQAIAITDERERINAKPSPAAY